ncbi:MAG: NUDIX domain-containing protein [Chitinophagaceae bacterium]|nr:NUDIX domain-containing protein [Chitinophagaceae bacterium]
MIKILFNDKKIMLTDDYATFQQSHPLSNAHLIFDCNRDKLLRCIDTLMISELQHVLIVGPVNESLDTLKSTFTLITAGGGVVQNQKNDFLFIYRRGKWDLPKGKAEEGEVIEDCALREVMEETGVRQLEMIRPLCTTYHLYFDHEFIFKETFWFLMKSNDRLLRPQAAEGISKALWVNGKNIGKQLQNTYESIRDIFDLVLRQA